MEEDLIFCTCKVFFNNARAYNCHLKTRPTHRQPVIVDISINSNLHEEMDNNQDDCLDSTNQFDRISWHQRYTNDAILDNQIVREFPIDHPDFFGGGEDSITYLSKQIDFYKGTFGIAAFRADNIEQFVNLCQIPTLSDDDLCKLKVLEYGLKHKLSRSAKDDMLKLMKDINLESNLPSS